MLSQQEYPVAWATLLYELAHALAQKNNIPPEKAPLSQFMEKHFAHWDRNHDDVLDRGRLYG